MPKEIKRDLLEKEFKCESVAKKNLPRNTMPVYLLTLEKSVNLKEVRALSYVYNVKVKWERYGNNKNHMTNDCSKKDDQPICTNCNKEHRADSKGCEACNKRVSFLSSQRVNSQPPKREPLPPPLPSIDGFLQLRWTTTNTSKFQTIIIEIQIIQHRTERNGKPGL